MCTIWEASWEVREGENSFWIEHNHVIEIKVDGKKFFGLCRLGEDRIGNVFNTVPRSIFECGGVLTEVIHLPLLRICNIDDPDREEGGSLVTNRRGNRRFVEELAAWNKKHLRERVEKCGWVSLSRYCNIQIQILCRNHDTCRVVSTWSLDKEKAVLHKK